MMLHYDYRSDACYDAGYELGELVATLHGYLKDYFKIFQVVVLGRMDV